MPLINGKRLTDRHMRDAYRMVYAGDTLTQEGMRIQSEYRRALVREATRRKARAILA